MSSLVSLLWLWKTSAELAQVVERRPEKPGVPSASLGLGTFLPHTHLVPAQQITRPEPDVWKKSACPQFNENKSCKLKTAT